MRGERRKTWDDEYVLKRQFSALIPAFDPRPGRTNVNQTQDFEIPPPGKLHTKIRKKKLEQFYFFMYIDALSARFENLTNFFFFIILLIHVYFQARIHYLHQRAHTQYSSLSLSFV